MLSGPKKRVHSGSLSEHRQPGHRNRQAQENMAAICVEELLWKQSSTQCQTCKPVRKQFFQEFYSKHPQFKKNEKLKVVLEENKESCILAGQFVSACHRGNYYFLIIVLYELTEFSFVVFQNKLLFLLMFRI